MRIADLSDLSVEGLPLLVARLNNGTLRQRKKAATILAEKRGIPIRTISASLSVSHNSVRRYVRLFVDGGVEALFAAKRKSGGRLAENEQVRKYVFSLLHEPPSVSGINRTTWRMDDLTRVLRERGTPVCAQVVREITQSAGWRWRKARKVLTSTDPEYREKVQKLQSILAQLQENEAFFSIDEFGPFSVRAQGGRALVAPDKILTVPQYQKSKGSLIMTAALELSQNQLSYFYSPRKDTGEMLRMLFKLLQEYRNKSQIYLSWDAASWHVSKMLQSQVAKHNEAIVKRTAVGPAVALAPLPAGAQFLNVIESVFSGMARAIIANSDYRSIDEARAAIDRYITERNEKFRCTPKRAGGAIWGTEREPPEFSASNNCKDPHLLSLIRDPARVRLPLLLLVVTVLASCSPWPRIDENLQPMRGQPIDSLFAKLGYPQSEGDIAGRHFYVWEVGRSVFIPESSTTSGFGSVGGQPFNYSQTTFGGGSVAQLHCALRVFVAGDHHIIMNWDGGGNNAERF
jgi:transposase